MSPNDIKVLLKRYLDGKCSAEESRLVENWLAGSGGENTEWKNMNDTIRQQWLSDLYEDVQRSILLKDKDKNIKASCPTGRDLNSSSGIGADTAAET